MQHFDYRKFRKTLVAALGVALMLATRAYSDNPYVQAAVAVATVFGIYEVPNDPAVSGKGRARKT